MPKVQARCPKCGAYIQVNNRERCDICRFCLRPIIIEKAIAAFTGFTNGDAGFEFSKDGVLINCFNNAKKLVIPEEVTAITENAFNNCDNLTSLKITKSVKDIDNNSFNCCSIKEFIVSRDNPYFSSGKGVLFDKRKASLIRYPIAKEDEAYTVPSTVTNIHHYAFNNCKYIKNVIIPEKLQYIGMCAFNGTPFFKRKKNWKNGVFYLNNHIVKVDPSVSGRFIIENGINYISPFAFENCSDITAIFLPDTLISIGGYAFYKCTGVKAIKISNEYAYIGPGAFMECQNLKKINLPKSITQIRLKAFYGCESLTSITFPDRIRGIGSYAFANCISLESLTLPDRVLTIGMAAFFNCGSLTSVTIPDSVSQLGHGAFMNCRSLNSIHINPDFFAKNEKAFDDIVFAKLLRRLKKRQE